MNPNVLPAAPAAPIVIQQAAAAQATVGPVVSDAAGLGPVLADGAGRTTYLFTKDGKNPPKTTCDGQCATTWPPVITRGETRVEGVDPELVGSLTRPDGHTVGGTWFAIDTNGCTVAAEKKPVSAAPSSPGGYDY